jgi:hypothetical protein
MKNSFFIATLMLSATGIKAQQAVPFKIKYLPKHTYVITSKMEMTSQIETKGSFAKSTGPKGNKHPLAQKGDVNSVYTIHTGHIRANGSTPYTITVTNYTAKNEVNGKEQPAKNQPTIGSTHAGEITADGKMHIAFMPNAKTDSISQKQIIKTIHEFVDGIKFPDKPLKVGDTFTQEDTPVGMSGSGRCFNKNVKTVYTLTAIKGNLAFFDTKQVIGMDVSAQKKGRKVAFDTRGNGKGKMVYDISQHFEVERVSDMDVHVNLNMGALITSVNGKTITNVKTEIRANN